jgi:putative exporter of polyketide antibiotics
LYCIELLHITLTLFHQVEDYLDDHQKEQIVESKYAVERIAGVLAVTCLFLSVLYTIFAVLLFVSYTSDAQNDDARFDKPLVDQPVFITMEGRSDSAE